MSVEQTTQLIQLILNSVLMMVACVLLLNRISLRQIALEERLQLANRQCSDWVGGENRSDGHGVDRALLQAKKHLRQLQYRYKVVRYGMLADSYALVCAIASTLTLSLRTLLDLEWLVPLSLGMFVLGVTLLLLGVGLTLIDLHTLDRSLWDEITQLLGVVRSDEPPRTAWRYRSNVADRFMRKHTSKMKPASRARVS